MMASEDRTTGILIVALICLAVGVVLLIVAVMLIMGIIYEMYQAFLVDPALGGIFALLQPFQDLLIPANFVLVGYLLLFMGAWCIIAAIGVFMVKSWGRILAIIAGVVMLIIGVGLIVLYILFKEDTKMVFGVD